MCKTPASILHLARCVFARPAAQRTRCAQPRGRAARHQGGEEDDAGGSHAAVLRALHAGVPLAAGAAAERCPARQCDGSQAWAGVCRLQVCGHALGATDVEKTLDRRALKPKWLRCCGHDAGVGAGAAGAPAAGATAAKAAACCC